ncbi:MAG: hypothetical protein C0625_08560 [Arcobacter sp.]|nr:MAG: hypothetical protein C0625_08560 [Arcobacter sp.]
MILKFLAIAAVLFLIYIVLFKKNREKSVTKKEDEKIEDVMVECPTCNTFVSKKEAILSNGNFYCSKECLQNN